MKGLDAVSSTSTQHRSSPYLQLFIVLMGTFMAVLDTSVVNVAIPKMEVALNTNTSDIQWVLTGYMLVTGVIVPTSGWLIDTLGPKRLFLFALVVFTGGSALCGFAWNLPSIIFFRILQGIGGGLLQPVAQTVIYRTFPPQRIGSIMGVFGITIMGAPAFGPLISGYFVEYSSWRWIFFVNVPIGIVALLLAIPFMDDLPTSSSFKLDVWGVTFSTIGFFSLLYGFNNVPDHGWGSTQVRVALIIGVLSLLLFVITELRAERPLLQLRLLRTYTYTVSLIVVSILSVALFVGIFLMPLYLQNIRGYSALRTGLFVTPGALVSALVMPISGRLFDKIGARPLGLLGIAILAVSTYAFTFLTTDSTGAHIQLLYIVRSLAMGIAMMPIMTAGTTAVVSKNPVLAGQAAALTNTIRNVASGLGTAIMTVYMTKRETIREAQLASQYDPGSPRALQLSQATAHYLAQGMSQAQAHAQAMLQVNDNLQANAFVLGMNDTFMVSTLLAIAAWVAVLFIYPIGRSPQRQSSHQRVSPAMD